MCIRDRARTVYALWQYRNESPAVIHRYYSVLNKKLCPTVIANNDTYGKTEDEHRPTIYTAWHAHKKSRLLLLVFKCWQLRCIIEDNYMLFRCNSEGSYQRRWNVSKSWTAPPCPFPPFLFLFPFLLFVFPDAPSLWNSESARGRGGSKGVRWVRANPLRDKEVFWSNSCREGTEFGEMNRLGWHEKGGWVVEQV